MQKVNRKGQVGLDMVKSVMIILLVIGVIGVTIIIALSSLSNSEVAQTSGSNSVLNETITPVNETGEQLPSAEAKTDSACSVTTILAHNNTGGFVVDVTNTANFTTSNCRISFATGGTDDIKEFNNSALNVTYSFTFNEFADTEQNITTGVADFFENVPTWFALLSIVIIILIIGIIIFAVNRFGGSRGASL